MEDYQKWKKMKMEDDHNGRRPKWKMTKMEDDKNRRLPKYKTTKIEVGKALKNRMPNVLFMS